MQGLLLNEFEKEAKSTLDSESSQPFLQSEHDLVFQLFPPLLLHLSIILKDHSFKPSQCYHQALELQAECLHFHKIS